MEHFLSKLIRHPIVSETDTTRHPKCLIICFDLVNIELSPKQTILRFLWARKKLKSEDKHAMDMSTADAVRDELIKSNSNFRELVHQHQDFEKRLSELAHLTYPNDDEQLEETTLKKKKLLIKDEIYSIMQQHCVSH